MEGLRFIGLRKGVQEIIDLMGNKDFEAARVRLTDAMALLDEILDHSTTDEDILEAGHYSALLGQLERRLKD